MAYFFWLCALAGSTMFAIQFILTFFLSGGVPDDITEEHLSDAGSFKWLTRHSITGFVMMFGWSAVTCVRQFHFSSLIAVFFGLLAGAVMIFVTQFIFKSAQKLHSPGTIFKIEDSLGKEGVVYQKIPKNGVGKVTVSICELLHELDAESCDQEELPSFIKVRIVGKVDNRTVIVQSL